MLIGKKCRVGSGYDVNAPGFSYYDAVIVSEPMMRQDEDCYVFIIVQNGDRLVKADIDYIFNLDT